MSKICAIHQPNLFPWLGYFYKIAICDTFIFLDNVDIVTGTSKSITNRTSIKSNNGKQLLTIPIKKGESKLIQNIEFADNLWQKKFIKTIENSYRKAINFDLYFPFFTELIEFESTNLSDFNINAIIKISELLGLETNFVKASEFENLSSDRNLRIIELCKRNDCLIYFSGRGGANYHDEELFVSNKIQIKYTDFNPPIYTQLYEGFEQGLSILDYLFNVPILEQLDLNK